MKIAGIIPARYESSRFPGKPLALIAGKPMIWWVYKQVEKVNEFDEITVATDSSLIFDKCNEFGLKAVMTASTHQTGTDRLGEVASMSDADYFVNIQGDEPLIEPDIIRSVIDYKIKNPEVEIINTMTPLDESEDPAATNIVLCAAAENGDLLYLSRAAIPCSKKGEKIAYKRHMGLYGMTKEALAFYSKTERGYIEKIEDIEMFRFLENGWRIKIIEVVSDSVGVDLPEDIQKVEAIMKKRGIM